MKRRTLIAVVVLAFSLLNIPSHSQSQYSLNEDSALERTLLVRIKLLGVQRDFNGGGEVVLTINDHLELELEGPEKHINGTPSIRPDTYVGETIIDTELVGPVKVNGKVRYTDDNGKDFIGEVNNVVVDHIYAGPGDVVINHVISVHWIPA